MHPIPWGRLEPPCTPFTELLRVSERISRDCSSLEWIGKESNLTTWNNGSLSIHKLCPLCASYPFEYYPPFGSINRLTQTQEPFVPRKHVTSDNMFFRCFSACTSTAHFLSARAVQGQPISPIQTSCATTYRISILMVLESFLDETSNRYAKTGFLFCS